MPDGPTDDVRTAASRAGLDATGRDGGPATSPEYRVQPERTVGLLATALARLHSISPPGGPTDPPAATMGEGPALDPLRVARAVQDALAEGRLAGPAAGSVYGHLPVERLVEVLVSGAQDVADRSGAAVLCHGAPTLEHLWCDRGEVVGFVEWRRAVWADPYLDLAIAARDVAGVLTPLLVPELFERYGETRPDPIRVDWWALAAELTGAFELGGGTEPG